MDAVSSDRVIEGEATRDADWRGWLTAARVPAVTLGELLPTGRRLVVIAPHPDDEVLACGALIARHAAMGGEVLVVALSDGEASHGVSTVHAGRCLAAERRDESAEGLRRLGAREATVIRLGLPDGAIADHADSLVFRLARLLRASDVVVSPWRLDGHPDHDAAGRAAARACRIVGCRLLEAPVWMWHWAAPGDARVPWRRLVGLPMDAWTAGLKQHALAAHVTQLRPRDGAQGPVLGDAIRARAAWRAEYFLI